MLTDPEEIAIISLAKQANVRDPKRSRVHFEHIFADFLDGVTLRGARVLDIGPGQWDFGVIARERGADVVGIDRDPAVLELGRHKGFDVIEADLRTVTAAKLGGPYDAIFCKYSINAFWFHDDADGFGGHMATLLGTLKPDGWGWIAPWNGAPKSVPLDPAEISAVLEGQRAIFATAGFDFRDLTVDETRRYGVHGATANNALFTRFPNRSRHAG